jgi:small subunit ribosomal protein S16
VAVRLRLARTGRTNRPFYRVGAFDSRTRRDGPPIEYLGWYDPLVADFEKGVHLEMDRVRHWIEHGAKCSDTVASFVRRRGMTLPRNVRTSGPRTRGKSAKKQA